MKITNCKFLKPFGINAIVLYPFVLYCDRYPSPKILCHEQVHLDQIKKDGMATFYLRYLKEYFAGRLSGLSHHQAYMSVSYEKEAYRSENLA